MKETFTTIVRHALTFLTGLGAALHSAGLINAEEITQVNGEGVKLQAVLTGLVVAVVTRLVMKYGGKFFKDLGHGSNAVTLMLCMAAGFVVFSLPSCTYSGAVPVRASYVDRDGNVYAYDPVTGVTVMIQKAEELIVDGAK